MLRHSQYNQPWIKWPSAWHMWKAVHYIGLFLWKHPSYGADLNNSNIKEVWLIYCFFFFINNALFHEKLTCLVFGFRLTCDSSFPQPPLFILPPTSSWKEDYWKYFPLLREGKEGSLAETWPAWPSSSCVPLQWCQLLQLVLWMQKKKKLLYTTQVRKQDSWNWMKKLQCIYSLDKLNNICTSSRKNVNSST